MKTKIYLVKSYIRFYYDEIPTWEMRLRATALWATGTREEAAQDVRELVKEDKQVANNRYKKYWYIQEINLFKALSNN